MMLSSLLDAIEANEKKNRGHGNLCNKLAVVEFLALIKEADKFDFGLLPTEAIGQKDYGGGVILPYFRLPELTDDEIGFWLDGLLPIANKVVWYEFTVEKQTSGLLVKRDEETGKVYCQRIEYYGRGSRHFSEDKPISYMIDGTWVTLLDRNDIHWKNADPVWKNALKLVKVERAYELWGSAALLSIYLTLMINSKTTELRTEKPTPRQQQLRRQLRKHLLPTHTIVTIVPKRFIDEANDEDKANKVKGTHASPRIHWRRSHIRTYHRDTPQERKVVIARQIVGRRELGEVTHDYVVRMKT